MVEMVAFLNCLALNKQEDDKCSAHSHRRPRVARIAVLKEVTTHQYENGSVPGEILTHPKLTIETEWTSVHEQIISLFQ